MKYAAVVFDLFGTLVDNHPWDDSLNNLRQMASALSAPDDEFVALWHATFDERMNGTFKSYQDCIGHICQQLAVKVQDNEVELAAGIRFNMTKHEVTVPREGAIEVLSHLKSNGHKTGLLSNCSAETTVIWKESPLAPLIDVPVFSSLAEIAKPDPRIYQIATEKLAVNPEECLYIADGIGGELMTAAELGMRALQIRVPYESDYDTYREQWNGPVISSLREVLTLVR